MRHMTNIQNTNLFTHKRVIDRGFIVKEVVNKGVILVKAW